MLTVSGGRGWLHVSKSQIHRKSLLLQKGFVNPLLLPTPYHFLLLQRVEFRNFASARSTSLSILSLSIGPKISDVRLLRSSTFSRQSRSPDEEPAEQEFKSRHELEEACAEIPPVAASLTGLGTIITVYVLTHGHHVRVHGGPCESVLHVAGFVEQRLASGTWRGHADALLPLLSREKLVLTTFFSWS